MALPLYIPDNSVAALFQHARDRNAQDFLRACQQLAAYRNCKVGKVIYSAVDREGNNFLHHIMPYCTSGHIAFIGTVLGAISGPRARISITNILTHKNVSGVNPAIAMAGHGVQGMIDVFKNHNLIISGSTPLGQTALRAALERRDYDMAQALIAAGVDVNEQNNRQATALHMAVHADNIEMAAWLLDHGAGASVHIKNSHNISPTELAEMKGQNHMLALLRERRERQPDPGWW